MGERVSFNINAELYEDRFGDLAVRLPGNHVYRDVAAGADAEFLHDTLQALVDRKLPPGWHEMPPHELLYGKDWRRVGSLGFVNGETDVPGMEFDLEPALMGAKARAYLREILPVQGSA